ncbi:putative HD superfamily hydrolase of NAD metabolism [Paenibacillus uliginis N3/975]|uniref:bis(5'-nucleosyl)-tetraphosphatase (symmetrical) n=1 Tax=Paenibacillus uliginis N3/975 TaxID=1313296 RepID=A0A1X7HI67_9BACL|nr:bis(5'-nucleosyl)-tetraphosphatase (symmetrical) YqeK [Paenibacillus uliginis]SMF87022.1 putative HD superfamily hydrolase of NAD metabolism [Paenibacillus uliginis N3/975]
MNNIFNVYIEGFNLTGDLYQDITLFFTLNNDQRTLEHTLNVADEAKRIAERFEIDPDKVIQASLLHDISNVIPVSKMLNAAEELSIEILDEERKYSRSVHQKLSKCMAQEIFNITDDEVLSAIESHTTHKSNATTTDKILFVSDKISWELPGEHTYLQEMRTKVYENEIDQAIMIYLNHIWDQRNKLKLVHPWLIQAREELLLKIS